MKKYAATIVAIALLLLLCCCANGENESESDITKKAFTFQDITFELDDTWNFKTVEEMQSTDIEIYDELSRNDWDGLVDERVLISDDTLPTFVYCFSLANNLTDIDDFKNYIELYTDDFDDYDITETKVNGNKALKMVETIKEDNESYYYTEIVFVVDGKAYSLYTMGSDSYDYNEWLNKIIESISFSEESANISWKDAYNHIGEDVTLEGKIVDSYQATESTGSPTFLDMGASYPDDNRVTIVIWEEDLYNFDGDPEAMYMNETVEVTGTLTTYDGVAQIEIESQDQIKIK